MLHAVVYVASMLFAQTSERERETERAAEAEHNCCSTCNIARVSRVACDVVAVCIGNDAAVALDVVVGTGIPVSMTTERQTTNHMFRHISRCLALQREVKTSFYSN